MSRVPIPLVALALCHCGDTLPSPALVDGFRVLALGTETPEVRPGDPVTVRALWYDPDLSRSPRFAWRLCEESDGFDPRSCADPSVGVDLEGSPDGGVTVPGERLRPARSPARYVLWSMACPGATPSLDPRRGRVTCPSPDGVESFRRISVRSEGPLNQPPAIARWTLHETSLTSPRASVSGLPRCASNCPALTLSVVPSEGSAEATPEGPRETLLASFFTTGGRLEPPRDAAGPGELRPLTARFTPPSIPLAEGLRLWVLLRDQRGGEAFRATTLTLE